MAHCLRKGFQIIPNTILFQQKRFRGKINIQKPRKPHYLRGVVNLFLSPFYENENKGKSLEELCTKGQTGQNQVDEKKIYNPYQRIIAREVRNWFDDSKMVAICHQNTITSEEQFELEVPLRKVNMYYKRYNKNIMKLALADSPYEASLSLYSSSFSLVFSPEVNVAAFEKIIKKSPHVILIAGVLEGRVLNKENFLRYGKLDLTTSRMHLVQILQNAGGNNLNQQLTQHQSTLVARLKQISISETAPDEKEQSVPV